MIAPRASSFALILALAGLATLGGGAGCAYDPYCFQCGEGGVDGGDLDVVSVDGRRDSTADRADQGDGRAADVTTDSCNPLMVMDDPRNCGACGNVCNPPHAVPFCANGACVVNGCDVGFVDLNGIPQDGCEYACLTTGAEVCDNRDNDCNGLTDDTFDKQTDLNNCGACGTVCAYANGTPTCDQGTCRLAGCLTGFADNNHDPSDGCEYHCPVYPPLPNEACNGVDDNCDGQVDEAAALQAAPANLCNTLAGTPCAGAAASCATRGGVTTWYCNYGTGVEFDPSLPNGIATTESRCDGVDNNCDGQTDEAFPEVGRACDNGLQGACRDVGVVRCNPADATATVCDLSVLPDPTPGAPSAELCNNVDDDCDGTVDNPTGSNRVARDMVHVTSGGMNFYIDRYEASRSDASATSQGTVDARACSNNDALPWTRVTFATAQSACAAFGLRLCTAAEWGAACATAANNAYPYGTTYQPTTCNGADYGPGGGAMHQLHPTGDPGLSACVTMAGVHDLSGNAKEWTNDPQGMTSGTPSQPIYVVRGGSFESPELGLTCATTFSRAAANTALDDIGFRCCSNAAP